MILPTKTRRLSDKLLIAFQQACEQGDVEVARHLLDVLEMCIRRGAPDIDRRRGLEALVAAHHQLWQLQRGVPDEAPFAIAS